MSIAGYDTKIMKSEEIFEVYNNSLQADKGF